MGTAPAATLHVLSMRELLLQAVRRFGRLGFPLPCLGHCEKGQMNCRHLARVSLHGTGVWLLQVVTWDLRPQANQV